MCSSQNTSLGLILGIVIPVIILLAIVAIIAALVVRHWRRQARKQKLLEPIAPELVINHCDLIIVFMLIVGVHSFLSQYWKFLFAVNLAC